MNRLIARLALSVILVSAGCTSLPPTAEPVHVPHVLAHSRPPSDPSTTTSTPTPAADRLRLVTGLETLRTLTTHTAAIDKEFGDWWQDIVDKRKRAFGTEEADRAGALLFRYGVARNMLWDLASHYASCRLNFADSEAQTRAFAIGYGAAVLADARSARLVNRFIDEPLALDMLNAIHLRYDVPAGSLDALFLSVTSPSNIQAVRSAHRYVNDEMNKPDSMLARIVRSDPDCARLLRETEEHFSAAQADTDRILKKKSLVLPGMANLIRQTPLAETTRRLARQIGGNLYVAQGLLFNSISDIKRPMAPPVDFNPDQVDLIKSLLQPGDLIFTFTAGYMSNVFLPGRFKHGLTYVGSPAQRAAMGLAPDAIRQVPPGRRDKLAQDIGLGKLPSGYDADVIEAVAEGVIFNSLDYLLKHHVNRIVVLRPRIGADERVQALGTVFLLLGGRYDFNFDFVDTSYQCCTEVIYRAFNRKGDIDFPLIQRMAVKTLAADDILHYHLAAATPKFDFIVLAEEDPDSPIHMAAVFTGTSGARRLHALMAGNTTDGDAEGAVPVPDIEKYPEQPRPGTVLPSGNTSAQEGR